MKMMTAMYTIRRGGSYDRFLMMGEAFMDKEWEVHILSLTPVHINHRLYHNHIIPRPFRSENAYLTKAIVLTFFPFYSIVLAWREKIDLFVAFGSLYAFLFSLAGILLRKPIVTFIRGEASFGLRSQNSPNWLVRLYKTMEHLGLSLSDHIITVNSAIRDEIIRFLGEERGVRLSVLHNNIPLVAIGVQEEAVQMRDEYGIPMEAKIIVTAGVINSGKNIEFLIKCLPRIPVGGLFLFVAGEGSTKEDFRYQASLIELTGMLGLTGKVIFTGWMEKKKFWALLRCADLFVLASKNEGMPNVILEALGSELPCMGSRIPGIAEILQYEELMFDPFRETEMERKIQRFFCDELFHERVKALCQERRARFTFDWKEKVYQAILKEVVEQKVG